MGRLKKNLEVEFSPDIIHQNAMAYCVANNVIIIPELIKKNEIRLNIRIEKNGRVKNILSPKTYTNKEIVKPIYEIYLAYFRKMADQETIKISNVKYLSFVLNN
jgi:hypothetical protein